MIDTPGHVDFTYEVSRSLAACEGAVLLVDAAQGIEAQTLANLYLAMENELTIIPVLNKIDLPAAQPEKYAAELAGLIGCEPEDCLQVSGKTGVGVEPLLDEIVRQIPAPVGDPNAPARAMIFDSVYDTYRGVVTYVRVIDGNLNPRERIVMMSTKATHELLEIGVISPEPVPGKGLGVGEVGYLITGVKDVRQSKVGDTVTNAAKPATEALGGYRDPKPMVFSGPVSRSTARTTPTCARRSTSSSSTTPRSSTSRRPPRPSASGSGAASSGCCTWRSCASGSSASSTST
jgi:GTP-binding protein LepA